MLPIGLTLVCFFYYLAFLLHYGEMFYKGSDIVANTAYGMTLLSEVHRAGWTVPKPAQMLLFGSVYWLTRDLWFIHLVLILGAALTVWAGCRLIHGRGDSPVGCIAFCAFMMTIPRTFDTTLAGGPGCLNVLFLLLALVCAGGIERKGRRTLSVVFLSLANLTRPDSWPSTYLIILVILALRFFDRKEPALKRADLAFLIPLAMPLVWVLVDWRVFGDPLYSVKIARTYLEEAVLGKGVSGGREPHRLAAYFPRVKEALFDLFSLGGWLSIRTGLVGILCAAGTFSMFRRQPRTLLLVACPLVGTLLFYGVYAFRGTLFRIDYIYTVYVCVLLIAGAGLGSLCSLAMRAAGGRPAGRIAQVGLGCLVLAALTVEPFQEKIVELRLPVYTKRAVVAGNADAAIKELLEDVKRTAGAPIILTDQWIPASRISMRLGTGKDVFLVERLVSKERMGRPETLPEFRGRTVYCCFLNSARRDVALYLRRVIDRAVRTRIIYDKDGLVVVRCSY